MNGARETRNNLFLAMHGHKQAMKEIMDTMLGYEVGYHDLHRSAKFIKRESKASRKDLKNIHENTEKALVLAGMLPQPKVYFIPPQMQYNTGVV